MPWKDEVADYEWADGMNRISSVRYGGGSAGLQGVGQSRQGKKVWKVIIRILTQNINLLLQDKILSAVFMYLWLSKSLIWQTMLTHQCHHFYLSIQSVQDTCAIILKRSSSGIVLVISLVPSFPTILWLTSSLTDCTLIWVLYLKRLHIWQTSYCRH